MHPALFANLEFSTALERATAERKILLVDATAEWCGPCQLMNRTTWVDTELLAWLRDHAVAIQVDVDAQKELAQELRIEAMPTIVAFVSGKEFDRVVGAKGPKDLLTWLKGVMRGETSLAVLERSVRGGPADMRTRHHFARELARAGRRDEALIEYVWLWEHMLEYDPALYGVRVSFLAHELEMLAKEYPPARATIMQLRGRVCPPVAGPVEPEKFSDWTCLNRVLGEHERTLAWYDALPAATRPSVGQLLERHIIPLLLEAERWAEAGALCEDPLDTINRAAAMPARIDQLPPKLGERMRDHFRKAATQLVRALSAARRVQDVDAVARRASEIDPSGDMVRALVEARSMSVFRAEIQLAQGAAWQFVAECLTSEDAWKAVGAFARDYYAAQVIYPTSGTARS